MDLQRSNGWADDALERKAYADLLTKYLERDWQESRTTGRKNGFVLSLNAPWGLGKTFFLTRWVEDLRATGHTAVYFDAWKTDFSAQPLIAFVEELDSQLVGGASASSAVPRHTRALKRSAAKYLKAGGLVGLGALAKWLAGVSLDRVMGAVDSHTEPGAAESNPAEDPSAARQAADKAIDKVVEGLFNEQRAAKKAIEEFRSTLTKVVTEISRSENRRLPLFVMVDEVDRCRPSYAIELLETVKHLFGVSGVYFIVACDARQLPAVVQSIYGANFDGEGYLRRFFDREYELPEPNNFKFADLLFKQHRISGEALWYSPILPEHCHTERPALDLFAVCAETFGLGLRDQHQAAAMLKAIEITTGRSEGTAEKEGPLHLGLLLVLVMARIRNRELFERLCDDVLRGGRPNGWRYQEASSMKSILNNSSLPRFQVSDARNSAAEQNSVLDLLNTYLEAVSSGPTDRNILDWVNRSGSSILKERVISCMGRDSISVVRSLRSYPTVVRQVSGFR